MWPRDQISSIRPYSKWLCSYHTNTSTNYVHCLINCANIFQYILGFSGIEFSSDSIYFFCDRCSCHAHAVQYPAVIAKTLLRSLVIGIIMVKQLGLRVTVIAVVIGSGYNWSDATQNSNVDISE